LKEKTQGFTKKIILQTRLSERALSFQTR